MSKAVALHICCSVCLIAPLEDLQTKGYKVRGVFFNPNIQPFEEHLNRLNALKSYLKENTITSLESANYDSSIHLEISTIPKLTRNDMCIKCYKVRLEHTVIKAKMNKINAFSTTLLSSPFQDKDKIRDIATGLEKSYKITFIDSKEWEKKHFDSKNRIKSSGLYVQKYCGCIYSKMDRKLKIAK